METEYDYGFIESPEKGKGTKITVNQFRNQWYVHIREYFEDADTGEWYPTKKGLAFKAENIDIIIAMLTEVSSLLTDIYYDSIKQILPERQLNLFIKEEEYDSN